MMLLAHHWDMEAVVFLLLTQKFKLNILCYSLVSMKIGKFNSLNSQKCKDVQSLSVSYKCRFKSCASALLCLSSSARHQGYLKLGKPFMVLSSSLASEGKGPTSAYKLRDWGPGPPWYARCVTTVKFVAVLPQSTLVNTLDMFACLWEFQSVKICTLPRFSNLLSSIRSSAAMDHLTMVSGFNISESL